MHPVKQPRMALFAGIGTNTQLFAALAATECEDPEGCPGGGPSNGSTPGTLNVGTI